MSASGQTALPIGEIMFEQIHSKKNYLQIVEQVRNLVVAGKLKKGDRLPPERELSLHFGTSRASIREALSALEILGIIETKSGQGNFIKADSSEVSLDSGLFKELLANHSPYEIYEARLELEPCLASLAAVRACPEEKKALRDQLEKLKTSGRLCIPGTDDFEEKIDAFMEEDRTLHLLIGKSAHNSVLFMVFSGVNLMMREIHWKTLKAKGVLKPGNLEKYEEEHENIINAILEGNQKIAQEEMLRHISDLDADLFQSEEETK